MEQESPVTTILDSKTGEVLALRCSICGKSFHPEETYLAEECTKFHAKVLTEG